MVRFLVRGLVLSLMAMVLAACGGSDKAVSLPGVSGYTLSIATVDAATSAPATTTSAAAPLRIDATLLDADSNPVAGATVSFVSSVGVLGSASATTDLTGVASVVLNAGSGGAAVGQIAVSFQDPEGNVASEVATVSTTGDDATSGGGGGGGTPTNVLRLVLSARDGGGSVISATNPISSLNPGRLIATVTLDGVPVSNALVTFSSPNIATLSQATSLTDATGGAEVTLTAVTSGAGFASATATYNDQTVSSTVPIATSVTTTAPVELALGSFDGSMVFQNSALRSSAAGAIAPGSTITISADVVDASDDSPYTTPVLISFTSNCAQVGNATIDASDTTSGGHAEVTYRPAGACGTSDTVTATFVNGSSTLTATVVVSILPASVGEITFESATPANIALAGTGGLGRLTRSDVKFIVNGTDGSPVPNQLVCFALSTSVGGLAVTANSTSNAIGEVIATVDAGSVPTAVRVNATVDSDNDSNCATVPSPVRSAVSDTLVVSTGLPDQNSLSLSIDNFNPLSYNIDGVNVSVTARAADHFNNPVPDGTAITFWSELGAIEPSCTTVNGACSVTWTSQNPRANGDTRDAVDIGMPTRDRKGRSTIVAYAVGEESFTDTNGNGRFDDGEPFTDLPEVIKDSNENEARDEPGLNPLVFEDEEFVDFDLDGSFDTADGEFDGVLCSVTATNCSGDASVNVRDTGLIVMSTTGVRIYVVHPSADFSAIDFSTAGVITGISNPVDADYTYSGQQVSTVSIQGGARTVGVFVTDANGNAPAKGTTIEAEIDPTETGELVGPTSYTVPNSTDGFYASFTVRPPSGIPVDGVMLITVTVPGFPEQVAVINIDAAP